MTMINWCDQSMIEKKEDRNIRGSHSTRAARNLTYVGVTSYGVLVGLV